MPSSPRTPRRSPSSEPERRHDLTELAEAVRDTSEGVSAARESLHDLRSKVGALVLRLDLLERHIGPQLAESEAARDDASRSPAGRALLVTLAAHDARLRSVEEHVKAAGELVQQGRGALSAMRWLAGGSILTAAATIGRMAGWW